MNGVNLGGWLVLERWLTPSVFEGTDVEDEFGFMQTPGALKRIKKHRDTFITEEDWRWLARHDIKFVRIPVGYWVLQDDGPFKNARTHLDRAFRMAEKYKMKVLLDFHALKGSQNGEMHSGVKGKVEWWQYRYENLERVRSLAKRYAKNPALWGLEIINEPKVIGHYFHLLWYYRKAYAELRNYLKPGTYTVFHDGFVPPLFAGALWPRRYYPVAMDSHYYLIFSKLLSGVTPRTYDFLRGALYRFLIATASLAQPVIIGEWGSVLPQPMFDREKQENHYTLLAGTIRRQRKMYRRALATAFWNYKAEGRGMYHYRSLVEDGVV